MHACMMYTCQNLHVCMMLTCQNRCTHIHLLGHILSSSGFLSLSFFLTPLSLFCLLASLPLCIFPCFSGSPFEVVLCPASLSIICAPRHSCTRFLSPGSQTLYTLTHPYIHTRTRTHTYIRTHTYTLRSSLGAASICKKFE